MIEIRKVSKTYGKTIAVNDISLDVKINEILCILGPNGSGKTTLINMICGILKPTKGSIFSKRIFKNLY